MCLYHQKRQEVFKDTKKKKKNPHRNSLINMATLEFKFFMTSTINRIKYEITQSISILLPRYEIFLLKNGIMYNKSF